LFTLYVKNSFPYPDFDEEDEAGYAANLGDVAAEQCGFQGFADRLYCIFQLTPDYFNTLQKLEVNFSLCGPIYVNEGVSILTKDPGEPTATEQPKVCNSEDQRKCIAVGGIWYPETCTCSKRY
jgi:hypothetical protein